VLNNVTLSVNLAEHAHTVSSAAALDAGVDIGLRLAAMAYSRPCVLLFQMTNCSAGCFLTKKTSPFSATCLNMRPFWFRSNLLASGINRWCQAFFQMAKLGSSTSGCSWRRSGACLNGPIGKNEVFSESDERHWNCWFFWYAWIGDRSQRAPCLKYYIIDIVSWSCCSLPWWKEGPSSAGHTRTSYFESDDFFAIIDWLLHWRDHSRPKRKTPACYSHKTYPCLRYHMQKGGANGAHQVTCHLWSARSVEWPIIVALSASAKHNAPNHESQITKHKSQIACHEPQNANHESRIMNHRTPIAKHESWITNCMSRISKHRTQNANRKTRIMNHKFHVTNHKPRITTHISQIKLLHISSRRTADWKTHKRVCDAVRRSLTFFRHCVNSSRKMSIK